jgi:hypothetical protein
MALAKPLNVSLDANGVATITPELVDNGSSDNCSIASRSLDKASFDCSNVGDNTVVLTVKDPSGNSSSVSAIVTVTDNTPPTVITKNISIPLFNGSASITAADVNNGSSDACGIKSMTVSLNTFDCNTIGDQTVTLTVSDNNNNVSTGTAVVTVVGSNPIASISVNPQYTVNPGEEKNTIYLGYGQQNVTLKATSGVSYVWFSEPSGFTSTSSNPTVSPTRTTKYTVIATNEFGCEDKESVVIFVVDARDDDNKKKVLLCHGGHTLSVSANAVQAHLSHGDKLGKCDRKRERDEEDEGDRHGTKHHKEVKMCHNGKSIIVDVCDVKKHLAHGDKLGMCKKDEDHDDAFGDPVTPITQDIEMSVMLEQNYPNPFATTTEILYFVSKDAPAIIVLTDIYGRTVANLLTENVTSGWNQLTLNGSELSSGTYFVRLVSMGKVATLKIVKMD